MVSHIEWTIRRWSLPGGSGSLRDNGFGGFVSSLALPGYHKVSSFPRP